MDILGAGPLSGREGMQKSYRGVCRRGRSYHDMTSSGYYLHLCCWSVVGGALPGYPWRGVIDDSAAFHHFDDASYIPWNCDIKQSD